MNKVFDSIASKYGIKRDVNDSDSTLKGKIKETIIMSRAWKYALTVPFVTLGIGLASQEAWKGYGKGLKQSIKSILNQNTINNGAPATSKAVKIWNELVKKLAKPVKNSFVQLWTGKTKAAGIFGKTVILATVLGTIYANLSILRKTYVNDEKIISKSKEGQI